MTYTVLEIYEEDHGCEGIQPGEEPMDMLYVRTPEGDTRWLKVPDRIGCSLHPGDTLEWE